jgi:hypothetical protein
MLIMWTWKTQILLSKMTSKFMVIEIQMVGMTKLLGSKIRETNCDPLASRKNCIRDLEDE